jgi:transposase
MVSDNPLATSTEIASSIQLQTGKKCTPKTIRNTLHKMDYKSSLPRVVPLLTDNMKVRRVAWAQANAKQDWNLVVFTDETSIQLQANIIRAWHKNQSRPNCPRPKYPKKAMFWGGVSRDFKTDLYVIEGSVTAQSYITLLREKFVPFLRRQKKGSYVFQQDNAPAHTAKITKQFFSESGINVLDWPANSPDLNPIENMWGILKRNVDKRSPKTKEELISFAQSEWKKISLSSVRACIDSMPRRLEGVIHGKGEKVDY